MPITEEHIKEELCRAHISAIAAMAGLNQGRDNLDYGVDGRFVEVEWNGRGYVSSGVSIEYQAKATVRWEIRGGHVVYALEADAYNAIAGRGSYRTPLILILLCLPRQRQGWHRIDDAGTYLREHCYWHIFGPPKTTNISSVTIQIPLAQRFTPEALQDLLLAERDAKEVRRL